MGRRYALLIELIVALSLAAFLFSSLFQWFAVMQKRQASHEQTLQRIEELQRLKCRLAWIFASMPGSSSAKGETVRVALPLFFFCPTDNSLVFTYWNGSDIDVNFSNTVLAKLYVEEHEQGGRLCVARWPLSLASKRGSSSPQDLPFQCEVLCQKVLQMKCRFYSGDEWRPLWPLHPSSSLPDFLEIEVMLKEGGSPIRLIYQVANGRSHRLSLEGKSL